MHKHKRECLRICQVAGLNVLDLRYAGKHMAIVCSEGVLSCPCTPSDQRWARNFAAQARRLAAVT